MDSGTMTIAGKREGEVFIFHLTGWLNTQSYKDVEQQLQAWVEAGEKWMIGDMTRLDFVSSMGLRVLLSLANQLARSGGRLALFGLKEPILDVFDSTGISSLIPISSSKEDAQQEIFNI